MTHLQTAHFSGKGARVRVIYFAILVLVPFSDSSRWRKCAEELVGSLVDWSRRIYHLGNLSGAVTGEWRVLSVVLSVLCLLACVCVEYLLTALEAASRPRISIIPVHCMRWCSIFCGCCLDQVSSNEFLLPDYDWHARGVCVVYFCFLGGFL